MSEPSMQDVFDLYQRKVALLSSAQKEKLMAVYDEGMSPFVMGCAILRARQEQRLSRARGRDKHISFNYIYRIMQDWLNHGITTEERFLAYWEAVNEDGKRQEGTAGGVQAKEKIRREDFTYEEPRQDKSLFSFLDE
ncbi:MAG: DnaD domain protein [Firmicutes bacterium]|nr:DnaD domain protein [Bacillota bacterium]NLO65978.1 DnaD domain protein [Bacillota bacterium]